MAPCLESKRWSVHYWQATTIGKCVLVVSRASSIAHIADGRDLGPDREVSSMPADFLSFWATSDAAAKPALRSLQIGVKQKGDNLVRAGVLKAPSWVLVYSVESDKPSGTRESAV